MRAALWAIVTFFVLAVTGYLVILFLLRPDYEDVRALPVEVEDWKRSLMGRGTGWYDFPRELSAAEIGVLVEHRVREITVIERRAHAFLDGHPNLGEPIREHYQRVATERQAELERLSTWAEYRSALLEDQNLVLRRRHYRRVLGPPGCGDGTEVLLWALPVTSDPPPHWFELERTR